MIQDALLVLVSRSVDLGRPTPRWVGWASRVWPRLAEEDRRLRLLDAHLRATADQQSPPPLRLAASPEPRNDAWRGLFASGVGLAAAAAVALALLTSIPETPPPPDAGPIAGHTSPPEAAPDTPSNLTGLLDRVQTSTPASLRVGTQLQDWASFLMLELPNTHLETLEAIGGHNPPAAREAEAPGRVS